MLAIAAFASCEKEPEGEGGGQKADGLTILAVTDGTLVPAWTAGDEIKVAVGSKSYDFTATTAGKSAKFTDDGSLTAELIGDNAVSAYYNCSSARGAFRISGEQTYRDGKSSAAIPMYAYTMNAPANNTLAMTFKPLASVLRVTLPVHPISVETITVRAAEEATVAEGAIAGTYVVNVAEGTVSVNADAESVEMTFATPLDITQGGTVDIPVGWFAVNGGLEIVLGYESTKEMKFVAGAEGTFKSYSDADGFKAGAVVPVEFEMDVNSFPREYYVTATAPATGKGQSWSAPATLDYALTNAMAGSTIHVAAGTYNPTKALPYTAAEGVEIGTGEELNGFEVKSNVTIIGGYPASPSTGAVADASVNKTILDGNNKSNHVLVVGAAKVPGEKVVIKGITVTKGYNTEENTFKLTYGTEDDAVALTGNKAAGLGLINTEVELENVTVTANKGNQAAGIFGYHAKVTMKNCTVSKNSTTSNGGGAWFDNGCELIVDGCTISENSATHETENVNAGGFYLHVGEGETLTAQVKNTTIYKNSAKTYAGGIFLYDQSGNNGITASFESCNITENTCNMSAALQTYFAKATFVDCIFDKNVASGNGTINIADDGHVHFDRCHFTNNQSANGGAIQSARIIKSGGALVAEKGGSITATNCEFTNNTATGRGGALYLRGTGATYNIANCTFSGNKSGHYGSAIAGHNDGTTAITANIMSCTLVGNTSTTSDANKGRTGAIGIEKAPWNGNVYNTIIAGNTHIISDVTENNTFVSDVQVTAGSLSRKYSFVGSDYYGSTGATATVTPAFDYTTMLGALNNGVMKLIGAASANPAVGNGMPVADLKALANDYVTADVLGKDQNGTARTGAVAGACVTQ